MTEKRAHHKKIRFTSAQEVKAKSGNLWPVYEQIKAFSDPENLPRLLDYHIKKFTDAQGLDIRPLIDKGANNFVGGVFGAFLVYFAESKEPLEAFAELQDILLQVRDSLESEATRRRAMLEQLVGAKASWLEIAVLLTENWDDLTIEERATVVDGVRQNHRNYKKKYGTTESKEGGT